MVTLIFAVVYLGMILGGIPGLGLDRAGIALLGAIALVSVGMIGSDGFWHAVDIPTIALLFSLMVVSAQFRLSGYYSHLVRRIGSVALPPWKLMGLVIAVTGILSAFLANDIICLAMTPVLIEICSRRGFNPLPFLLALACAANVGSASTLIGNPQNMLIGQVLGVQFGKYLQSALVPAAIGLVIIWIVIAVNYRQRWHRLVEIPRVSTPAFNRWQTNKGVIILTFLILCFLYAPIPREVAALSAAGVLLLSRKMRSREIIGLVDWNLLVMIISLFIVNYCIREAGISDRLLSRLATSGIHLQQPPALFLVCTVLSNLVSNVPAVMLLLPVATHPMSAQILALSSTLAGNMLIVGSLANIIVVEQAATMGVKISWREHAIIGVPVTILTLAFAAGWIWMYNP